jgi:hypothetical protein
VCRLAGGPDATRRVSAETVGRILVIEVALPLDPAHRSSPSPAAQSARVTASPSLEHRGRRRRTWQELAVPILIRNGDLTRVATRDEIRTGRKDSAWVGDTSPKVADR